MVTGIDTTIRNTKEKQTALHWALASGSLNIVNLLFKYGVSDYECQDSNGYTSVHIAVQNDKLPLLHYLCIRNANINASDYQGLTPLHWSGITGTAAIMRYLLARGADAHVADIKGMTALHWASYRGNIDSVRILCDHVNDPNYLNLKDSINKTPIDYSMKFPRITQYLETDYLNKTKYYLSERKKFMMWIGVPWVFYLMLFIVSYFESLVVIVLTVLLYSICLKLFIMPYYNPTEQNPIMIGVFYSSISTTFIVYSNYCLAADIQSHPIFYSLFIVWCIVMTVMHYQLTKNDPGEVKVDRYIDSQKFLAEIENGIDPPHVCSTCLIRKPARSKHCPVTNRCIIKFDHYCVWIHNSVGIRNHLKFITMLSMVCVAHLVATVSLWYAFADRLPISPTFWDVIQTMQTYPILSLMLGFQPLNAIWESQLIISQYILITQNLTFNEKLHWKHYSLFRSISGDDVEFNNPFDKGVFKNVISFVKNDDIERFFHIYHKTDL